MTAAIEKIADIDGMALHYREAGAGKTIVFLHGAGGAPPAGAAFVPMLAERHRLLIPSRPGFDDTPLGPCASVADVTDIMARFIRQVAGGKAHVVAQSAGGAIGCWLAILHPDLVETLVLSAPAAFASLHQPPDAPGPSPAELAQILYGEHPDWATLPTEAERRRIARNTEANMARFRAAEGNPELLARLGEIAAPTLLLWATQDRLLPAAAMLPYQLHIPSCTRVFIYGAAHEMPIAAAKPWVRLVSQFVDRGEMFVVNMGEEGGG
jgi:pimeloyl-ACP methyl ester carboxylesterase